MTSVSKMFAAGPAAIATSLRHVAAFQYASGPSASRSSVRPFSAEARADGEIVASCMASSRSSSA